jgi:hypothetical protein
MCAELSLAIISIALEQRKDILTDFISESWHKFSHMWLIKGIPWENKVIRPCYCTYITESLHKHGWCNLLHISGRWHSLSVLNATDSCNKMVSKFAYGNLWKHTKSTVTIENQWLFFETHTCLEHCPHEAHRTGSEFQDHQWCCLPLYIWPISKVFRVEAVISGGLRASSAGLLEAQLGIFWRGCQSLQK